MKKMALLLVSLMLMAVTALAEDFSADMAMTSQGQTTKAKVYMSGGKIRVEPADGSMIMITRTDRKVVWMIMPQQKSYMETPLDDSGKPKVGEKVEGEISRKEVGSETIDGRKTTKFLVTVATPEGQQQFHQWYASDFKMGVRTAALDGSWKEEYRNIKLGAQPASLFELPGGYSKMTVPQGAHGM